jgi:hypothetical protein
MNGTVTALDNRNLAFLHISYRVILKSISAEEMCPVKIK